MRPVTQKNLCRLQEWRQRHRLSIKDVAELVGLSEAMLNLVERGKRNLSPVTRVWLARALGVSVGVLFDTPAFPREDLKAAGQRERRRRTVRCQKQLQA